MYIPLLLVTRQVGIILGPMLIFITNKWNFELFGFIIDDTNSAGLMIAILWSVTLILNLVIGTAEPMGEPTQEDYIVGSDEQMKQIKSPDLNGNENGNGKLEKGISLKTMTDHKWIQVIPDFSYLIRTWFF